MQVSEVSYSILESMEKFIQKVISFLQCFVTSYELVCLLCLCFESEWKILSFFVSKGFQIIIGSLLCRLHCGADLSNKVWIFVEIFTAAFEYFPLKPLNPLKLSTPAIKIKGEKLSDKILHFTRDLCMPKWRFLELEITFFYIHIYVLISHLLFN